jgi:hypothetical protein
MPRHIPWGPLPRLLRELLEYAPEWRDAGGDLSSYLRCA